MPLFPWNRKHHKTSSSIPTQQENRVLWAVWQNELGNTSRENPLGDRMQNLEDAIDAYHHALEILTYEAFPQDWAAIWNNLGLTLVDRIRGDKAQNLEDAIDAYHHALKVFTYEAFPVQWAYTWNNLGNAFSERIRGDKAQNLEDAIDAYHHALEILTYEAFPIRWATTWNNLGLTLTERIRGDKAQNLEDAINAHDYALEILTYEAFPQEWAATWNNLGLALADRIRGDKAQNQEDAIDAFRYALKVRTREAFPQDWAMTWNNLGATFLYRIRGDKAQNLEDAIDAYRHALEVYTREAFPQDWANTWNNLGLALQDRIRGDKAQNLEDAIDAFRYAHQVYTCEAFPVQWAMIWNNLGTTFLYRIRGDEAQNLEDAIDAFRYALEIRTREAFPQDWAMTWNNLGATFLHRVRGDKAQNLENAIDAYRHALEVYTREAFPQDWANTWNNLGIALKNRIRGDKAQNLEDAIDVYHHALEIRTREAFPIEYRGTWDNLAFAYELQEKWNEAHHAYLQVRSVQADLLALAVSSINRSDLIAAASNQNWFLRDALALSHSSPVDSMAMAEALEAGRAQNMRADLALDNVDLQKILDPLAQKRARDFIDACNKWRAAQQQQSPELQEAYHAFVLTRDAIRRHDNPAFLAPELTIHDIAKAVRYPDEALVYLAPTEKQGIALLVYQHGAGNTQTSFLPLPQLTDDTVLTLLQTASYHEPTRQEGVSGGFGQAQMGWAWDNLQNWGNSALEALQSLPPTSGFAVALLRLQKSWQNQSSLLCLFDTPFVTLGNDVSTIGNAFMDMLLRVELERSLARLGTLGITDVARELITLGIRRVTLIPYGQLALFPLPAIIISPEGDPIRFGDRFEVTVAPSAISAAMAKERAQASGDPRIHTATGRQMILAVGNPAPLAMGNDLPYAESEADTTRKIAQQHGWNARNIAYYTCEKATRKNILKDLSQAWYIHLATHGQYLQEDPRQSRIILAGDTHIDEKDRIITLDECLNGQVNLVGARLIVLSACETSLIETHRAVDEVVGMASGFLQAGAAGVIASLWPVHDQATYLLMSRFINLWLDPQRLWTPARCLAEAQRWLRDKVTNRLLQDPTFDPSAPIPLEEDIILPDTILPTQLTQQKEPIPVELTLATPRTLRFSQTTALLEMRYEASQRNPDECPFADPIYWAAFTVTGC
jgi:CHAT domain-containing protein/tetratricopeptide (TPR) repeat protein